MNDILREFIEFSKEKLGYEIVVTEASGLNAFDQIFCEDCFSHTICSTEFNDTFEYKNDDVTVSFGSESKFIEYEIGQALAA